MTGPSDDMTPVQRGALLDEATEWFARLRGPTDADLNARFADWRDANLAHARAYAEVERLWHELGGLEPAREPALEQARRPVVTPLRALAAGLTVALVGLVAVLVMATDLLAPVYFTGPGEQRTLFLADGSTVHLNTRSKLKLDFSDKRRRVVLVRGEALFDVAHDAQRPFQVDLGETDIMVVGTRFNVHRRPDSLEVAVVGGSVAIETEAAAAPIAPLGAGDRVALGADTLVRDRVDPDSIARWRTGRLLFKDTPLDQAVADLNRYLEEQLILGDPALAELKLTGLVRIEDRDSITAALTAALPVKAVPLGNGRVTLLPKKNR